MPDSAIIDFSRRYWALVGEFPADLCGYANFDDFFAEGILPCAPLAEKIPNDGVVLDLGSGGGLPGLVFAYLRPRAQFHLLEPLVYYYLMCSLR